MTTWQRNDKVTGFVAVVLVICMLPASKRNTDTIEMSNLQKTLIWSLTSGPHTHDCTALTANSRNKPIIVKSKVF